MRKCSTSPFLILLFLCLAPVAMAHASNSYHWGNVAIGGGGYVTGLVASTAEPGVIYARTDVGGAYRWDNERQAWIPLTDWVSEDQVGFLGIESIALDPQHPERLYMVVGIDYFNHGNTALLRSDDYGDTMEIIPLTDYFKAHGNGMGRQNGERLVVDPNNSEILYAGTRRNGLFRSHDRGSTWEQVESFPMSTTPNDNGIVFVIFDESSKDNHHSQRIIVGVSVADLDPDNPEYHDQNLYISEDAGQTWSLINGRPRNLMPQRAEILSNNLLIITYANGAGPHGVGHLPEPVTTGAVWKYDLDNQQWTSITPSGVNRAFGGVSSDPGDPDKLVVSTINSWFSQGDGTHGDRIYLSDDGGLTWTDLVQANSFTKESGGINWIEGHSVHWAGSLLMDPFQTNRVFVTSGNGIFMTDQIGDPTEPWKFMVSGMEETVPLDLISIPGGPLISVIGDYDGFVHHNPDQYGQIHEPQIGTSTSIDYAEQEPSFVVRLGGSRDGSSFPLYYSETMGENWLPFASTPDNLSYYQGSVAVSADASTVLWKPENANRIYRTTNRGQTWSEVEGIRVSYTIPVSDPVEPLSFYAYNPSDGSVLISNDGGMMFEYGPVLSGNGSAMIRTAPEREGDIWIPLESNGLYRSTDKGESFNPIASVDRASAIGFGKKAPGATYPAVFVWGSIEGETGLFRSDDEGQSWNRINDDRHQFGGPGNGNVVIGDPDVFGKVYMSTAGRGIVYGALNKHTSEQDFFAETPKEWQLKQNYPNPFNPVTIIPFNVPEASHVTVSVFDVLGREIAILERRHFAPGKYSVEFDASHLPSGVYLYQINTGTFSQTRKMLLVK